MGLLLLFAALLPSLVIGVIVGTVMAVKAGRGGAGKLAAFLRWTALATIALWLLFFGLFTWVMVLER